MYVTQSSMNYYLQHLKYISKIVTVLEMSLFIQSINWVNSLNSNYYSSKVLKYPLIFKESYIQAYAKIDYKCHGLA